MLATDLLKKVNRMKDKIEWAEDDETDEVIGDGEKNSLEVLFS